MTPCALTIAGSDPSGGAGLQADLKVFQQHKVYGASVVTLITVQNTQTVSRVELLDAELVAEQFHIVTSDLPILAIKTGALGSHSIVKAVAECLKSIKCPVVVDPVMISTHGKVLLEADARGALVELLIPKIELLTPNIAEAELLSAITIDSRDALQKAAEKILALGVKNVLIKGGHRNSNDAVDTVFGEIGYHEFYGERHDTKNTHGSGCVFSAAITSHLACGLDLLDSITKAKHFVADGIRTAPELTDGYGPLNLFSEIG